MNLIKKRIPVRSLDFLFEIVRMDNPHIVRNGLYYDLLYSN